MTSLSPRKKVVRAHLKMERDRKEQQIQAALADVQQGAFNTITAAADYHDLPYKTLWNRAKGRKSRSEAFQGLQTLSPGSEDILVQHIKKQADFGFPVTPEKTIADFKILPENIYNMDETGFLIGYSQSCNIIMPHDSKNKRFRAHPGNRETITVIECIGARGPPPPPMVIFSRKNHMQGWYHDHDVAADWVFATSPKGWTDDNLAPEWLHNCFDKHTREKAHGNYRLLILDGHGSHVTILFIQQAWELRIVCLCLPPHATHLLLLDLQSETRLSPHTRVHPSTKPNTQR
ncbi:related to transposase [Sporisorium reilianum f. sp. reilianum]|uniref:Related to transposase n=1 Tax=Sporisorium reilianum f. sp. reilianum TaxID=72559 RepID=A0A2N8UP50_9BASI|nr:related to transposase [Sporisorium reilianum f. sp. reilianum]